MKENKKTQRPVTEKQINKIINQDTTPASYGCGIRIMRKILAITLFLLPFTTAAGQVHQENNYDAITKDKESYFYNKNININKDYGNHTPQKYDFGYSYVTTPKDTFVCHTHIFVSHYKTQRGKSYGSIHFMVEDFQKEKSSNRGWIRGHTDCEKLIKHYGKRIHYKAKAYCVYNHPETKKLYVKCYIADVNYFPDDKAKSTVEYSIKYKKYRPIEKYHVAPLDSASIAKADAKRKEKERVEQKKYDKWYNKQVEKIKKKAAKKRRKQRLKQG